MLWVSLRLGRITRQAQCMVSSVTSPPASHHHHRGKQMQCTGGDAYTPRGCDRVMTSGECRPCHPLASTHSAPSSCVTSECAQHWNISSQPVQVSCEQEHLLPLHSVTVSQWHSVTVSQCRVTLSKSLSALLAKLYICRASLSFSSAQCLLKAKNHFISLKPLQSPLNFSW